jgi:hypothetical protein
MINCVKDMKEVVMAYHKALSQNLLGENGENYDKP